MSLIHTDSSEVSKCFIDNQRPWTRNKLQNDNQKLILGDMFAYFHNLPVSPTLFHRFLQICILRKWYNQCFGFQIFMSADHLITIDYCNLWWYIPLPVILTKRKLTRDLLPVITLQNQMKGRKQNWTQKLMLKSSSMQNQMKGRKQNWTQNLMLKSSSRLHISLFIGQTLVQLKINILCKQFKGIQKKYE